MVGQFNGIHAALCEEINDIRESVISEDLNNSRSSFVYADGSIVIPVDGMSGFPIIGRGITSSESRLTYEHLFTNGESAVRDEGIMKIRGANMKVLATYADLFTQKDEQGSLFGMVVVYDNKKINPLHPIISAMMASGELRLPETFTIILYTYHRKKELEQDAVNKCTEELIPVIEHVMKTKALPTIRYRATNSLSSEVRRLIDGVSNVSVSFTESGDHINHAIIPVQLATRGIVYPYYGIVYSEGGAGNSYSSRNMSPMLSGNIDTRGEAFGQTCVGSLNNYSFSSLYVLSNMNIDSMYFSEIFYVGNFAFIQACQNMSAEILASLAGIERKEEAPVEEKTEEQTIECTA
jgi:hypothetical protein